MGLGGGVFRYSYHWTKALKRLPRRCHGISISWFAKHYLCTQQHEKGERCHLDSRNNLPHAFPVFPSATSKGSNFVTFVTFGWLILQYLWWHDPMIPCWSQHPICRASQLVGSDWNLCWTRSIYINLMGMDFVCMDGNAQRQSRHLHLGTSRTSFSNSTKLQGANIRCREVRKSQKA